ncbi:MAG: YeeE/YedE thiosulfate transporter family protein [Chitinophagaceae bacterium]
MPHWITAPWPWYVAGVLIGLTVPALLLIGNKSFGISSSLRHLCAACLPANIPFFKYDWKKEKWNLFFVTGILLGAVIAVNFLGNDAPIKMSSGTVAKLHQMGVQDFNHLMPTDIFNWASLLSAKGLMFMVVGGFLVGFGTRYAGGCTSGHAIMGLSNLQWPSLVATICFMIGGFASAWFIVPLLLKL